MSRRFGGLRALHDVTFDIEPNTIHAVIGPNGAGKTTLFNVLSGFVRPTSGAIEFDGTDVTGWPPHRVTKRGLSRTFQEIELFAHLSVRDNVAVALDACIARPRLSRSWRAHVNRCARSRALADEFLERLDLSEKADQYPAELSYGDQRRVEIARALATSPKCVMLDEPTAGMSAAEASDTIDLMRELRDGGQTVVLIEHNMNVVMTAADRITVLNFGEKIADGAPYDVRNDPQVISAYLGTS